ncbi:hypothetical protein MKC66_17560 [[Clostridium] innocuum]|nr:hypothetical protein [[Clostridium] innocuum]
MEKRTKKDIVIIMICSALFAALYIIFENSIMEYGKNAEISIWLRFLPVFAIQFGMSCLGIIIVFIKNHESLSTYGVVKKHSILSIIGCLVCAIPTVLFLFWNKELHGFFPFQGMFLTNDILQTPIPQNIILYLLVMLVWGFGESLIYVILSQKVNSLKKPKGLLNVGALLSALIAILIHGMLGFDMATILEAMATFILMYGSIVVKEKTKNSIGNILIFFVIWNAL